MSGKTKLHRDSARKTAWILRRNSCSQLLPIVSRDRAQGIEFLRRRFPVYQLGLGQLTGDQVINRQNNGDQIAAIAEDNVEDVPDVNDNDFLRLPIDDQNDVFFPSTVPPVSAAYEDKVRDLLSNEAKDVFEDRDDSDQEHVNLIDVFDGSMDRLVEFEDISVSEDAVCQDVDLFGRIWPNLAASKFLVENWRFYMEGVREERERTLVRGVTDPRLFSNLLTILSKAEEELEE